MKQFLRSAVTAWLTLVLVLGMVSSSPSVQAAGPTNASLHSWLLASSALPDTPNWVKYGVSPSAFGAWLGAGDVNGDGYSDVLVSAIGYRGPGGMHAGRVELFLGSSSGLATTPAWWVQGGTDCGNYYCNVGLGMAGAGDVNGDGYDDVIVGAARRTSGQYDEGWAMLYYGSPTGPGPTPNWSAEGNQVQAYFGFAVSTAGDVNGDGYDDIIIGSGDFDHGQTNEGRAFVYLGSPTGLSCGAGCPVDASAAADWIFESDQYAAELGKAVGSAGDVNGDGYDDVIVGSHLYDSSLSDEGKVWAFFGSPAGLSASPAWSAVGGQVGARFGWDADTAGDVNGDGYDDVVVGAYRHDNGQTDEGRAYVYLGSAAGLATTPAWSTESDTAGANYGYAAGTAGDLNGDGYDDVIVGAWAYNSGGQPNEGKAWVYLGSTGGLDSTAAWTTEGERPGAELGMAVGAAGDVNGDGVGDLMVGADRYDLTGSEAGAVFVYHGIQANRPPVAEAGGPYTVAEGDSVTLDGTASYDPDPGDVLTYAWDLDNDGVYDTPGAAPDFAGVDGPASHPAALQVCDAQAACSADATTVEVTNVAPSAQAGADVTVYRGETAYLAGTWTDPAAALDEPYAWTWDVDGDGVADASGSGAYGVTAPAMASFAAEGVYNLTFTVADADGDSGQDSVRVTVLNRAPDCSAAVAEPALLWPANNKFVPMSIGGIVDADGDPLILTVTSIWQDEPVGKGNKAPDGKGVGTATAALRAEKLGSGDGRVYHVTFTASDGRGGACIGDVRVSVPHDQARPAVDGGPLYDSTVPTP